MGAEWGSGNEGHKTRTKIILGGVSALGVFVGLIVAQQVFASAVGYDESLGFNIHGVYWPGAFLVWWYKWADTELIESLANARSWGGAVTAGWLLFWLFLGRGWSQDENGMKNLHGSAHFASLAEIKKAGVWNNPDGVFIGAWWGREHWWQLKPKLYYLRDSSAFHVLCCAPTRSGKGVALVLPTLLTWKHSCLISDLKGELWDLTSGYRSLDKVHGGVENYCLRFEPGHPTESAHWNVLDEIKMDDPLANSQIKDVALILSDEKGEGLKDHWDRTGYAFLCGLLRYLLLERDRTGRKASMSEVYYMIGDPKRPMKPLLEAMAKDEDTIVSTCGQQMLDKPEQERGSVVSTAVAKIEVFNDPTVAKNTDDSHFKVLDLMNSDKPVSLYLITTPDNKERLKPLLRLFVSMYLKKSTGRSGLKNVDGRQQMAHKHQLLLMLDEFPSFGQLQDMADGLAFIAGYGMKAFLITQDLAQLHKIYSKDESITSNCHIQSWFQPLKLETAKYISDSLGECTVVRTRYNSSGKRISLMLDQVSKSTEEVKRSLLTPEEVQHLPGPKLNGRSIVVPGDMLITIQGHPPIYGKQPLYFKDPVLLKRAQIPPLSPDKYVNLCRKVQAPIVTVDLTSEEEKKKK